MHALTRGAARTTRAALDGGVCRTVRWRSTGVAAAAVHEPTTRYDRGAPLATLPLDACMRAGVPHERVTEAHWDCDALPAPAEPAQDAKAVPLADAYVRDVEPVCAEEASSSAAPARPPLWFCTLPDRTRARFMHASVRAFHAGRYESLRDLVLSTFPDRSLLARGTDAAEARIEELQCVLVDALLRRQEPPPPLEQLHALLYTQGTPPYVPKTAEQQPLRRLQRASLYRLFHAHLAHAQYACAAAVIGDPRLRRAQPRHLLRLLLRALAQEPRAPGAQAPDDALSVDPAHSRRMGLRAARTALEAVWQRHGTAGTESGALQLCTLLTRRRMHAELHACVKAMAAPAGSSGAAAPADPNVSRVFTALVRQMCVEQGAYAEAADVVQALPVAWRTRAMYNTLLTRYGGAWLERDGSVRSSDSLEERLWHELCTLPHLAPPDADSFAARLRSHAHAGRASHALRDVAVLRAAAPDSSLPRPPPGALFWVCRALLRAGHVSLGVRVAHRCVREYPPGHRSGAALLNELLGGVLTMADPPGAAVSSAERAELLRRVFARVLPGRRAQDCAPERRTRLPHVASHGAAASGEVLMQMLEHILALAEQHALQPDIATLLLLVRTAARWDSTLDARALREMARRALPDGHGNGSVAAAPSPTARVRWQRAQQQLASEIAAAFVRRGDYSSARRTAYLGRRLHRRVVHGGAAVS